MALSEAPLPDGLTGGLSLIHPGVFFNTVRHLRRRQILGQIMVKLRPWWKRMRGFLDMPTPPYPGCRHAEGFSVFPPGPQLWSPESIMDGSFTFLNHSADLGWPPDWRAAEQPKLWRYNLHYFEWLWRLPFAQAKRATLDWIEKPEVAAEGWEPYPTSLRLQNWIGLFWGKYRNDLECDAEFLERLWASIYRQVRYLSGNPEVHLLGNHLFENAATLALCGGLFNGPIGDQWAEIGEGWLSEQLLEQLPADGLHLEGSPMYHARIVYLLQLLQTGARARYAASLATPLVNARAALGKLCHPDGDIALLNDAAFGIYNRPAELGVNCLPSGAWALPNAGYYGWRGEKGDYLVCDAGTLGPDYLVGHAHGDIFSFECSWRGERVIVDSGVHDYEPGPLRNYCRSTAAHNTVEIDGLDQAEFWSAFRVARRGRVHDLTWRPAADGFELSGWHDGYRRLPGRPNHYRRFHWSAGKLEVIDQVTAARACRAVSRLHLHPHCRVDHLKERSARISFPGGRATVDFRGEGRLDLEKTSYCPQFGMLLENCCLSFSFTGPKKETGFTVLVE